MNETATAPAAPWIRLDAASIVVYQEAGTPPRYSITGEVALPPGLTIDRSRLLALGRVGERVVAYTETSLDLENLAPDGGATTATPSESRLPFQMSVSDAGVLETIELRAWVRCNVLLGTAQLASRDIPATLDLVRAPLRVRIGGGHLSAAVRADASDANIELCGILGGEVPGFMQGRLEMLCLDGDGAVLFRDDSSFEPGFGAPVAYRVTAWPKHGMWRATETLMLRLRAEVVQHAPALVIAARDFRTNDQDIDASA